MEHYAEVASATSDTYFNLDLTGIDHVLTKLELSIIKKYYLLNYTVTEIASIYGISRQAVNQTKNRALKKLKKWFKTNQ
ncbi:sigma factor-like helix-turn-helix DNA-binding protein [Schinkia azotoformans]|uniref:sigma factor-like helix-turn-helix DNA-binding protein n=1 Tax=Schinkia azotoformans TaxID=1454 RepID=UPI00389A5168